MIQNINVGVIVDALDKFKGVLSSILRRLTLTGPGDYFVMDQGGHSVSVEIHFGVKFSIRGGSFDHGWDVRGHE